LVLAGIAVDKTLAVPVIFWKAAAVSAAVVPAVPAVNVKPFTVSD
jgi:hypothetical protein